MFIALIAESGGDLVLLLMRRDSSGSVWREYLG
jgi:hypothetical protein